MQANKVLQEAREAFARQQRETERAVNALELELEEDGKECADLDELVHEAASREASSTNNAGMNEQLHYLIANGFTVADIKKELKI